MTSKQIDLKNRAEECQQKYSYKMVDLLIKLKLPFMCRCSYMKAGGLFLCYCICTQCHSKARLCNDAKCDPCTIKYISLISLSNFHHTATVLLDGRPFIPMILLCVAALSLKNSLPLKSQHTSKASLNFKLACFLWLF